MIRRALVSLCALALVGSVSLAEEPQQQAPDVNAMMAAALGTASAGQGSGKPALNWRELAGFLVDIDGMEKDKIDGGTYEAANPAAPGQKTSYSSVTRRFHQQMGSSGTAEIVVTILDSGFAAMMMAPFAMAVEYDTPDGTLKSGEIKGFPAKFLEQYDDDLRITQSQVMIKVTDEILVTGEANEYVKPSLLKTSVARMDLAGLKRAKEAQAE